MCKIRIIFHVPRFSFIILKPVYTEFTCPFRILTSYDLSWLSLVRRAVIGHNRYTSISASCKEGTPISTRTVWKFCPKHWLQTMNMEFHSNPSSLYGKCICRQKGRSSSCTRCIEFVEIKHKKTNPFIYPYFHLYATVYSIIGDFHENFWVRWGWVLSVKGPFN
jgi:hypothetical protein